MSKEGFNPAVVIKRAKAEVVEKWGKRAQSRTLLEQLARLEMTWLDPDKLVGTGRKELEAKGQGENQPSGKPPKEE